MIIYKNKTAEGVEVEINVQDNALKNGFKEGIATDLEVILTDKKQDQYQIEVFLHQNWTYTDVSEIMEKSMLQCDAPIISVKANIKGIVSQN